MHIRDEVCILFVSFQEYSRPHHREMNPSDIAIGIASDMVRGGYYDFKKGFDYLINGISMGMFGAWENYYYY